jgi:hypothetical protein
VLLKADGAAAAATVEPLFNVVLRNDVAQSIVPRARNRTAPTAS